MPWPPLQGKKLFDENSLSEEEDSISESDQLAEGEEENQEEEEVQAPLMWSFNCQLS